MHQPCTKDVCIWNSPFDPASNAGGALLRVDARLLAWPVDQLPNLAGSNPVLDTVKNPASATDSMAGPPFSGLCCTTFAPHRLARSRLRAGRSGCPSRHLARSCGRGWRGRQWRWVPQAIVVWPKALDRAQPAVLERVLVGGDLRLEGPIPRNAHIRSASLVRSAPPPTGLFKVER